MTIHVYIHISICGKVLFREWGLIMWVLGFAFRKLTGPLLAIYTNDEYSTGHVEALHFWDAPMSLGFTSE